MRRPRPTLTTLAACFLLLGCEQAFVPDPQVLPHPAASPTASAGAPSDRATLLVLANALPPGAASAGRQAALERLMVVMVEAPRTQSRSSRESAPVPPHLREVLARVSAAQGDPARMAEALEKAIRDTRAAGSSTSASAP